MERGRRAEGVLVVSSSGGVLLDVMGLRPWWESKRPRWVAVSAPDTCELLADQPVDWQEELTPRRPLRIARAVAHASRSLASDRPEIVVSAGSGLAVPWFVAARLQRIPSLWVETFNVVGKPGLASRICAALATSVVVQHQELLARHPRAVYVGALY